MALDAQIVEGFVSTLLLKNFDKPAEIPDCHREWWDLCCSKQAFVAIAAPRGFAKSTAITFSYILANLVFRERSYVMIVSDTESQAIMFLQEIRKELENNEELINLFQLEPDVKLRFEKDTEADIIVRFADGAAFRVVAKGIEQKLRGSKWAGKRPDLIVCDDMENDEIVMNKERRDKARRWFFGALIPLRSDNGLIRVVGTILHVDSLLENFMPKMSDKKIVVEPTKTWTRLDKSWKGVKYRSNDDTFEHLLWPAKKSKEWLIAERNRNIEIGLSDVWSQEMYNIPLDASRAIFKQSDFKAISDAEFQKPVHYYVGCDFATTDAQRADYTVFVVSALDSDNILQIRHVIRERMDAAQIVETILGLQETYDPFFFAFEKGSILNAILPFLKTSILETGTFINWKEIASTTEKVARCRAIQGRLRVGSVRINRDAPWFPDFEDELLMFPRTMHDDQVDALSILGLALDKFVEAPTKQEIEEEEYFEAMMEGNFDNRGASPITGY